MNCSEYFERKKKKLLKASVKEVFSRHLTLILQWNKIAELKKNAVSEDKDVEFLATMK